MNLKTLFGVLVVCVLVVSACGARNQEMKTSVLNDATTVSELKVNSMSFNNESVSMELSPDYSKKLLKVSYRDNQFESEAVIGDVYFDHFQEAVEIFYNGEVGAVQKSAEGLMMIVENGGGEVSSAVSDFADAEKLELFYVELKNLFQEEKY